MATLLLPVAVRFYLKACRTSSRGRLFRFGVFKQKTVSLDIAALANKILFKLNARKTTAVEANALSHNQY
ncbi:MAG: hypothetical protein AAAC47_30555 [Pararhizobium sp.]